mmetsp:Transcript_15385/g.34920  ORF Transcript_15385/g.34920 Transcript_15385/m.34920 type:complete len:247 (-) Transcript_15385:390-1130(-)
MLRLPLPHELRDSRVAAPWRTRKETARWRQLRVSLGSRRGPAPDRPPRWTGDCPPHRSGFRTGMSTPSRHGTPRHSWRACPSPPRAAHRVQGRRNCCSSPRRSRLPQPLPERRRAARPRRSGAAPPRKVRCCPPRLLAACAAVAPRRHRHRKARRPPTQQGWPMRREGRRAAPEFDTWRCDDDSVSVRFGAAAERRAVGRRIIPGVGLRRRRAPPPLANNRAARVCLHTAVALAPQTAARPFPPGG